MKTDMPEHPALIPKEECEVLNLILNDHELIERLKITPEEMQALSKCAMFGTLTCKQHMLFILRQIREATSPEGSGAEPDRVPLFPEPALPEEKDAVPPDCRRLAVRLAEMPKRGLGSLEPSVRRRLPEQFGVLLWSIILVSAVVWNLAFAISRWNKNFLTSIGLPVSGSPAPSSTPWFGSFDQSSTLLWSEALLVLAIVAVVYLRSLMARRRLKIKPRRSWR